jgi:adenosylcobinamide kinase / adenosylcobinamide-phosphate guanylyltransferase
MGVVTLITGGVRSGKSTWALKSANALQAKNYYYVATAESSDAEMAERIKNHQAERDAKWQTIESSIHLSNVLQKIPEESVLLLDCCTVWLGNLWHHYGLDQDVFAMHTDELIAAIIALQNKKHVHLFVVSNEVGWGIVPLDAGVRMYRDWIGQLNQRIAASAQRVVLCVAGLPLYIKGSAAE